MNELAAPLFAACFLLFGLLILLYFYVMSAQRCTCGRKRKKARCQHRSYTTHFKGMEELRAMFSGRMSPEEYSKLAGDFGPVRHCLDCGAKIK